MFFQILAIPTMRLLFRLGIAPKGSMIRRSLTALKKDDLETAVQAYVDVSRRDFTNDKVQVLREILISEIQYRRELLGKRIAELTKSENSDQSPDDKEVENCRNAIALLTSYLQRLGVGMRELPLDKEADISDPNK